MTHFMIKHIPSTIIVATGACIRLNRLVSESGITAFELLAGIMGSNVLSDTTTINGVVNDQTAFQTTTRSIVNSLLYLPNSLAVAKCRSCDILCACVGL